jgi:hypothetical protein
MAINYKWEVISVSIQNEVNKLKNVIAEVTWTLTADDGNDHSASRTQSNNIALDPNTDFIPFDLLTHDEVIGWVKDLFSPDQIELFETELQNQINVQIENSKGPTQKPLPWKDQ